MEDLKGIPKFTALSWKQRNKIQHGCARACSGPTSSNMFFAGSGYGRAQTLADKPFQECWLRCIKMSIPDQPRP